MKNAIVLAAGFGSRLGEITRKTPKCLLPIDGKPMLQHVVERLVSVGVTEIIINTYYLAEQVEQFVEQLQYVGVTLKISREDRLLGTGGGIKQAFQLFSTSQDFFVYNADIYTDLDLKVLAQAHIKDQALASIACQSVYAARHLVFDDQDCLVGWANETAGTVRLVRESKAQKSGHYLCVQLVSPELMSAFLDFTGEFSLFDPFLRAAETGGKIKAVWFDKILWHDIGTPEQLAAARTEKQ